MRIIAFLLAGLLVLAACSEPTANIYRIRAGETSKVQYRMLDAINSLRQASGGLPVQLNAELNAAASTHARDMSVQNRPWHFGSDGSSPLDRAARAGYVGTVLGEVISESYDTEIETLGAWMDETGTRAVLLDSQATNMGFAWFQESNGKIWWTLVMGN